MWLLTEAQRPQLTMPGSLFVVTNLKWQNNLETVLSSFL